MNLKELKQVKKDLADGVIVSRGTWKRVLESAIESASDDAALRKLKEICEMQAKEHGDGIRTHLALADLCKEARTIIEWAENS